MKYPSVSDTFIVLSELRVLKIITLLLDKSFSTILKLGPILLEKLLEKNPHPSTPYLRN